MNMSYVIMIRAWIRTSMSDGNAGCGVHSKVTNRVALRVSRISVSTE